MNGYVRWRTCSAQPADALRGSSDKGAPAFASGSSWSTKSARCTTSSLSGTYRHGSYTYFTIYEPKERLVAAAPFRDRVVHHAIVRVIEPIFERRFIEDSFACRRGKGTHAAMRRSAQFARRFPYALKCDVRKYFPSIDHGILLNELARMIADERLLMLIAVDPGHTRRRYSPEMAAGGELFDVQFHKVGLPIGNLTSQFFANVYLNPLDHFVKHELRVKGYVRYLDDFVLFGHDRKACGGTARRFAKRWRRCNLKCTRISIGSCPRAAALTSLDSVVFADGRVRVRSSSVRRFDRRYKRLLWEVRHRIEIAGKRHAERLGLGWPILDMDKVLDFAARC